MWCETLGPGVSVHNMLDPYFRKYQRQQLHEMLDNAMNHASIMTWGWFNEGPSGDAAACLAYQQMVDETKARDPTRFQTHAFDRGLGDKCFPTL